MDIWTNPGKIFGQTGGRICQKFKLFKGYLITLSVLKGFYDRAFCLIIIGIFNTFADS